jgi:hypothetical protein
MTEDTIDRDGIMRRIRALQAKTTAAGCTEAEAMSAAALVDTLLGKYGLTVTEAEVKAAEHVLDEVDITLATGKFKHPVLGCLSSIGAFTDTKVWLNANTSNGTLRQLFKVLGEPQDVAVAVYLCQLLRGAIDREYLAFKAQCTRARRPCNPWTFRNAMAVRLAVRLMAMKAARDAARYQSTGTSLVVAKAGAIEASYDSMGGGKLRSSKRTYRQTDAYARAAGDAAGDRVNLGKALPAGATEYRLN